MTLVGFSASAAVVLAVGRSPVPVGMTLPPAFWGTLSPAHSGGGVTAAIVIVSVAVLLACWWWVLGEAAAGRLPMRRTAWMVFGWAAPLLLGPPLLSFDAYAYLAQGQMAASGLDPFAAGPVALGSDPIVDRVDPMWRTSPSPYGPVTLVVLRAVAMLDSGLTASVLALRLLAVIGVLTAVAGALLLSPPQRRPLVLALTLASPLILLHLVGGAHVDAVLSAFVVLSLLALRAGRVWSAVLMAGVAVAVKFTALPLLILVLALVVRRRGFRALWFSLPIALLPFLLSGLVLDRPWGFVQAFMVPGKAASWYAPASLVGGFVEAVTDVAGLPVSQQTADRMGQALVLLGGAATVVAVLRAAWRDERPDSSARMVARTGMILLTVALSLPALYSWYLGPAVFVVAAARSPRLRGVAVALSSLLTFSSLPPLYDASPWLVAAAWTMALGLLGASALLHHPRPVNEPLPADADRAVAPPTIREGVFSFPARDPAVRARTSRRAHRGLLVTTRAAELTVLPVLALALAAPGARGASGPVPVETVASEASESRVQGIANLSDTLQVAYPNYQIAQVLPGPAEPYGAQEFQVQLVRPGRWTCWLRLRKPEVGRMERVRDGSPTGPSRMPCPTAPSRVIRSVDGARAAGAGPVVRGR